MQFRKRADVIRSCISEEQLWEQRLGAGHLPVKLQKHRLCKVCSVFKAVHSSDPAERPKTSAFQCIMCNIPLCIGDRNCFVLFHSPEFEQYKDTFLEHCRDR